MKPRHPELVSGSILPFTPKLRLAGKPRRSASSAKTALKAQWMLKQVQHDECGWGMGIFPC